MTKIYLVLAPLDKGYTELGEYGSFQPNGLLALGSYLHNHMTGIDLTIIDGQHSTKEEIIQEVSKNRPKILGICPTIVSYQNTLEIAQAGKENGAVVILGGHHAAGLSRNILLNRSFVDYVVIGDGEIPLSRIVSGQNENTISGLVYRNGSDILINPRDEPDLSEYGKLRFSLLDLNPYGNTFKRKFPQRSYSKTASTYSQKGCFKQKDRGRCDFCGRMDIRHRTRNPEIVRDEIDMLVNSGIDFIRDTSDDFFANLSYVKSYIYELQKADYHRTVPMRIFARADSITPETVEYAQAMNVEEVFIGIETGDPELKEKVGKGSDNNQDIVAVRLLKESGIRTICSLVMGLEGTTKYTLENDLRHCEKLSKEGNVDTIHPNLIQVIPNSRYYFKLIKKHPELESEDRIDLRTIQQIWIDEFTNVNSDYIEDVAKRIMQLAPYSIGHGWTEVK